MPRKRSDSAPAKTGRTWSPVKGLTITQRGPLQFQARVRRTGWSGQTQTFETISEAQAWGIGVLDGFNRNTFVDRRLEARTTLANVFDRYLEHGISTLKGQIQARSQVEQLKKTALADRYVGDITGADVISWLRLRRSDTVKRKRRDDNGRVVRVKEGRRLTIQYDRAPIADKTVLNEMLRLSAVFEFARVELKMLGLRNPVEDVPVKEKPKRRERTRRLRNGEEGRLLAACRVSRCKVLAAIVELAWETACRRSEIVLLLKWEDIDFDNSTAVLRGTKSPDGSFRERMIGLSDRAIEILGGMTRAPKGRVFKVRPDNISRNFRVACERAGIADLTLHDQRSEGASRMAGDKGLNIVELAEQGGWRDLRVLRKYYRPDPSRIAEKLSARTV